MKKAADKKNLVEDQLTGDGFNNFVAKLGMQTENIGSQGMYTYGSLISRNHVTLEMIYRTSWIAGQVVDTVAEDMTKEGISMYSKLSPDHIQEIQSKITELAVWQKICSTIKWARLYGGAVAVMLTDGADFEKPLDISKIGQNSFKGLAVFDRWQVEPSFGDLITEMCPEMGMPKYYSILPSMEAMSGVKVHHTRLIRLDGIEMPYYQKKMDNLWGMSVIERMLDRLMAFDSATQGAAQLMYKAHLRVVQIDGLRAALAMGGKTEQAVIKQFQYIRLMQTNEGITLLDKNDTFTPHTYSFAGVNDVLIQFSQQISGATNIPLVRLFGQSPSGFSTGETDLRNYYDNIGKLQEKDLRSSIHKLLDIMSMSIHGKPLPDDFEFEFNSLWQMSEVEKSQVASVDATSIGGAYQNGIITKKIAMKELSQNSHTTGRFSNIKEEDIENAKEEPVEGEGLVPGQEEKTEASPNHNVSIEELENELAKLGGKEPEPEEDAPEELSLEESTHINEPSLEELEEELIHINEPSLEELESELDKIDIVEPDKSLEQLEQEAKGIVTGKEDKDLMQLEQELNSLPIPAVPKKITSDKKIKMRKAFLKVKDQKDSTGAFFIGELEKLEKKLHEPLVYVSSSQKDRVRSPEFKEGKYTIEQQNEPTSTNPYGNNGPWVVYNPDGSISEEIIVNGKIGNHFRTLNEARNAIRSQSQTE